jgi:hypothetical protein
MCIAMKSCKVIPFPSERRHQAESPLVYTLRVYLTQGPFGEKQVGTEIFRTIQALGSQTLEDLHTTISVAFGRQPGKMGRHYAFCFGTTPCDRTGPQFVPGASCGSGREDHEQCAAHVVGDTRTTTVESLALTHDLTFTYVCGEEPQWCHLLHVLSIEPASPGQSYPIVIESEGDVPAERPSCRETAEPDPLEGGIRSELFSEFMEALQIRRRMKVENRPLSLRTHLKPALKRLPPVWIKGICRKLGLGSVSRKAQGIERICECYTDASRPCQVWRQLPLPCREMVRWILLEQKGWVTLEGLFKRFGEDEDTSWWWDEGQEPVTALGLLRLHAIVFVGRARSGSPTTAKVAVIPVELRRGLLECACSARALDEAPPMPERSETEEPIEGVLGSLAPCGGRGLQGLGAAELLEEIETIRLEEFLERGQFTKETEIAYTHMLGRIRRNPSAFSEAALREFLDRIIRSGNAWSRLTAYKFGLNLFGAAFADSAAKDESRMIRQWARDLRVCPQEKLF